MYAFRHIPIKNKLRIIILLTSAIVLLLASSIFVTNEILAFRRNMVADLLTLAELLGINSQAMLSFDGKEEAAENLAALKAKSNILFALLFSNDGRLFASYYREDIDRNQLPSYSNLNDYYFQVAQIPQSGKDSYFFKDNHLDIFKKIIIDNEFLGTVYIQSDLTELHNRLFWVGLLIIVVMLASLLLAFVLASKLQEVITAPIYTLLKTMKIVSAEKNYSVRAKQLSHDELGHLIEGFNEMLRQIELRDRELGQYQDHLEEKVKQRTLELAEARDQALAANRAKSIFLANMSHEIRTPMNAVLGYAQILQRDMTLSKEQRGTLQIIQNSGHHLLGLINDILDISKIEAGAMEVRAENFYLHELIEGISDMFKIRCEQKQLIWRVENTLPEQVLVYADQGKLRQILINLLGNAVKFTETGEIILRLTRLGKESYRFEVIDTGPGIPKESQEIIFEPFQQEQAGLDKGGTGLGLAITQRQVELMQGHLSLVSEVGKGTCFSVQLPLALGWGETQRKPHLMKLSRLASHCQVSALVVDDVKENRYILSYILKDLGVEVREAVNGEEAVKAIFEKLPNIVFMDIRMPVMDGKQAVQTIRQAFSRGQLPCIAISASTWYHQTKEALEAGFNDFMSKPFHFEEVYHCLMKFLEVEFEPQDGFPSQPVELIAVDLTQMVLPRDLYTRLYEAAELNELTEIERLLAQMNQGDSRLQALANMLNDFLTNYDIESILRTLQQVHSGSG